MGYFKGGKRGFSLASDFVPAGNEVFNCQMNTTPFVDISTSPKTITNNDSAVRTIGLYGESSTSNGSAVNFTGNQYLSWANPVALDKYTISGWFKSNNTGTNAVLNYLIRNTYAGAEGITNGDGYISIRMNGEFLTVTWDIEGSTRYGGVIPTFIASGVWYHIATTFDSINKTFNLYLDGKNITHLLQAILGRVLDYSKIQPFLVGTVNVGGQSDVLSELTDCDIYTSVVRDYLINYEELKAELKKYPKI